MPYVFSFDHKHRRAPMDMKDLLGGKGANLAEMTSVLGLPVPPGFTITTDACRAYLDGGWPASLDAEVAKAVRKVEKTMGKRLGDPADPLLVSVRSGAKFSMPGMMDTVLNLGLNDESVQGLAAQTGDAAVRLRLVPPLHRHVRPHRPRPRRRALRSAARRPPRSGTTSPTTPGSAPRRCSACASGTRALVEAATGQPFPQDPAVQLRGAIEAVFESWGGARAIAYREREQIPHDLGTAVNVQTMVFGNRDDQSGTGVGFTRDASTGENKPYGDFLVNAQGEDVVAGIRNTEDLDALQRTFPKIHAELLAIFARLERHYRDMCDTEFTIEQGKLWMLQTRVGKRTGAAALRMAVEMTKQKGWKITQAEAIQRVEADHLDQVLHPQFESRRQAGHREGAGRVSRAPRSAACTSPPTTPSTRPSVARRSILVRNETSPEDIHGMQVAEGILTARGGLVSHAAVVARGLGHPGGGGRRGGEDRRRTTSPSASVVVDEGDVISLDGTTGEVVLGAMALADAEPPAEFATILSWADRVRKGKLAVRANADTGPDATVARDFGAEGIGLCRTEHMFLAEDRLPIVRAMILAAHPGGGGGGPRAAPRRAEGRLPRDPRRDGRPARHRPAARPAAARVPAVRGGAAACSRPRPASTPEEAALLDGRGVVARAEPDARHPWRPPRRAEAGPLRHAGAGAHGGGRRPARGRQAPHRRDHDPAHGHPRGAAARPGLGRGRPSRRSRAPTPRASRSRSAR